MDGKDPQGAPVDVAVAQDGSIYVTEDKNNDVLRVFFDPSAGDGAPMKPLPVQKPVVSADEKARCDAARQRNDSFSRVQRDVIDTSCVGCHGAGPGFAGGLAPRECDAVGNAQRLLARPVPNRGAPSSAGNRPNSELDAAAPGEDFRRCPPAA